MASNNGETATDAVVIQEDSTDLSVSDPSHEEKPAAAAAAAGKEKRKEVPPPEKKLGGRGDDDGSDDDPEILQGNVSDDEAITGGLESSEANTGYSIDFLRHSLHFFIVSFFHLVKRMDVYKET